MLVVVNLCNERRTCFSNLTRTLEHLGVEYAVVKNVADIPSRVSGIVLSGSPLRFTNGVDVRQVSVAIYCLLNYDVPTLGICFGFQLLNTLHAGSIKPFGRLVCEKHEGLKFSFNDVIDRLGAGFEVKRRMKIDGKQVICHIQKGTKLTGYLFHPEADGTDASGYLQAFLAGTESIPSAATPPRPA